MPASPNTSKTQAPKPVVAPVASTSAPNPNDPASMIAEYDRKIAAIQGGQALQGDRMADLGAFEAERAKYQKLQASAPAPAPAKPNVPAPDSVYTGETTEGGFKETPYEAPKVTDVDKKLSSVDIQGLIESNKRYAQNAIQSGVLGRMDSEQIKTGPSDNMNMILEARKAALGGMSEDEMNKTREKQSQEINRSTQGAQRQMQAGQNASGVRGGTASAQQLQVIMGGLQAKANMEGELQAQNRTMKREALNSFETSATASEAATFQKQAAKLELQKFNLSQAAKEKGAQLNLALGLTGMNMAEVGGDKANLAMLMAARYGGGGGGKIICTELHAQGFMDDQTYVLDQEFGDRLPAHIMDGYQCWAKHVVKLMKKSKLFTEMVAIPALAWARSMAGQPNFLGNLIMFIGLSACAFIGKLRLLLKVV